MPRPHLFLKLEQVHGGLYRIDVLMENIPEKFLGVAFDLKIDGKQWEYDSYQIGNIFKNADHVLALAHKRDDKLVFGVTLKRGFSIEAEQGILASFLVRFPDDKREALPNIAFEKGVFSILENERKDISDVEWQSLESAKFFQDEKQEAETVMEEDQEVTDVPEVLELQAEENFIEESENSPEIFPPYLLGILIFVVCALCVSVVLVKTYLKKIKAGQNYSFAPEHEEKELKH